MFIRFDVDQKLVNFISHRRLRPSHLLFSALQLSQGFMQLLFEPVELLRPRSGTAI